MNGMSGMHFPALSEDAIGWLVVAAGVAGTLWTMVATAYWLLRPGETHPDHPKWIILRSDR